METIETVCLRNGTVPMLAKSYGGRLVAKTYANLTLARRAAEAMNALTGPGWDVYGTHPWYVGCVKGNDNGTD